MGCGQESTCCFRGGELQHWDCCVVRDCAVYPSLCIFFHYGGWFLLCVLVFFIFCCFVCLVLVVLFCFSTPRCSVKLFLSQPTNFAFVS